MSNRSDERDERSSPEAFDEAVHHTKKLHELEALWWKLGPGSRISARLEEDRIEEYFDDAEQRDRFTSVLNRDIAPLLERVVNRGEDPTRFLFSMSTRHQELTPEDVAERNRRIALIRTELVSRSLMERAVVRATSKSAALDDLRWDLSIKKHDLTAGELQDIPYATLQLILSLDEGSSSPLASMRSMFSARKSIVINCHADDLDILIRDLSSARDNLREISRANDSKATQPETRAGSEDDGRSRGATPPTP